MKHIFGVLTTLINMVTKYFIILIIFLFDAILFGLPIHWIYNNIVVENFSTPTLQYFDIICLIFLFKIIVLLWKSVNVVGEKTVVIDNNKEE